jgi:hypothetical protein
MEMDTAPRIAKSGFNKNLATLLSLNKRRHFFTYSGWNLGDSPIVAILCLFLTGQATILGTIDLLRNS